MTLRLLLMSLLMGGTILGGATAQAADLEVRVTGLRSADGEVRVGLYASPEKFLTEDGVLIDTVVRAGPAGARAVFPNLAPGVYALAGFHDENGNGEFDQGFLGIPLEGYAFGNDARPRLSPPAFEDAAVTVKEQGAAVEIRMHY